VPQTSHRNGLKINPYGGQFLTYLPSTLTRPGKNYNKTLKTMTRNWGWTSQSFGPGRAMSRYEPQNGVAADFQGKSETRRATMSVEKKSLISSRTAAKKAVIARKASETVKAGATKAAPLAATHKSMPMVVAGRHHSSPMVAGPHRSAPLKINE